MTRDCFLDSVAAFYAAAGGTDAGNVVYVLPNKRSAMFLKMYVRAHVKGVAMMPRIMTIHTFVDMHADFPAADRREQLFMLYDAYRHVMTERGREGGIRDFDGFVFWGDMMLEDFDDIDRSLVNADDLFRNLRDVKEIQADYLDDDQKDVIRRIWGESRLTAADAESFWQHIHPEGEEDGMASRFIYLWEILADIYHTFHDALAARRMSSAGGQYRQALKNVRAAGRDDIPADTHYAFVGFNDLSTAETLMLEHLRSLGVASFFWDTAPLSIAGEIGGRQLAKPLKRLTALVRNFPMPEDYDVPLPDHTPEITVTAVPSDIGQAKAVDSVLREWMADGCLDSDDPLNTAIVLPDPGLLLPVLLSVPAEVGRINISMGLAYRTTTFASLLHSVISMQMRARDIRGATHYYYEDINSVLSHPHIQIVAPGQADVIGRYITSEKLYNIPAAELIATAPELEPLFAPVRDGGDIDTVASYLTTLFDWLAERLAEAGGHAGGFEADALAYFRSEVEALSALVARYGVTMSDRTFFVLFERIFNSRGLTVNGTPLEGLQILGVLETRALDFDNVVIMSMNESVFPRRQYTRTMIPNALRSGFGLPDFDSLEWTYAYSFYRLIARARKVSLFYDSRSDGRGNGELSRYISQMRHLMPSLNVTSRTLGYSSRPDSRRTIVIPKTDDVMARLDDFRAGGSHRLSASALKTYKSCPLKFYLQYACSMRPEDEPADYFSASEFGNVVHAVVQAVYASEPGTLIDESCFGRWLSPGCDIIGRETRRAVIAERYRRVADPDTFVMPAEGMLACRLVEMVVRADLEAECRFYCSGGRSFTFVGNECRYSGAWHIAEGLDVNFYMSIDRVDRIDGKSLRFVDFKTGDEDLSARGVEGLFDTGSHAKDGMLQLLTYCEAYSAMVDSSVDVQPVLHPMRRLSAGADLIALSLGGSEIVSYAAVADEFRPRLHALVAEIFDPERPLVQCASDDGCAFCPFTTLCGRIPSRY
ncbi:MAG: PD-(D/E)XK nuclease family protein [Muribaculaceae bacterium]|nr:PD-(D/E)XK nuclease family protein [Muribaculaceae bacterium]